MSKPFDVFVPRTQYGFCEEAYTAFHDLIENRSFHVLFRADMACEGILMLGGTKGVELRLQYASMAVSISFFRLAGPGIPSPWSADSSVPLFAFLRTESDPADLRLMEPYPGDGLLLDRLVQIVEAQAADFLDGDFTRFEAARANWKQTAGKLVPDPEGAAQLTFPVPADLPQEATGPERIARAFSFLAGHGFRVGGLSSGELEDVVLFTSDRLDVEVRYGRWRGVVDVTLSRRGPDGQPPGEKDPKNVPLSSILYVPDPGHMALGALAGMDRIDEQLARRAMALERYAHEVFGDDSTLERAYKRIARPVKG